MTILQPNKNRLKISILFSVLIFSAIISVVLNIYIYNATVRARHLLLEKSDAAQGLEAKNADLKNNLYKTLDFNSLKNTAEELSLTKESRPVYLESNLSVAASNLIQP